MFTILKILLVVLTAFIAGLVPTIIFFQTASDKKVLIIGGIAVAGSYGVVMAGLPSLGFITFNGLSVFPLWAIAIAFPVAAIWKLLSMGAPPPRTEEDRIAAIREKARQKAREKARRPGA
jgi:hypothetical protein